jgi:flagellar biosynthesis GTPase FlhF
MIFNLHFGKISQVEILKKKQEKFAIVKMAEWNMKWTECTRIMLSHGKPILLYHTENEYWNAYAYKEKKKEYQTNDDALLVKKRQNQDKLKQLNYNDDLIKKEKKIAEKQQQSNLLAALTGGKCEKKESTTRKTKEDRQKRQHQEEKRQQEKRQQQEREEEEEEFGVNELVEQLSDLNMEDEQIHPYVEPTEVVLDYGDIAKYKGDTRASKKMDSLLKKWNMKN